MHLAFLAALVSLWVTFVPCFLWIFAGAPFVERLIHLPRLSGALHAITAAVVGVILNLSIWFSVHVFFRKVETARLGWIDVLQPDLASVNPFPALIACVAAVMLFVFQLGVGRTLVAGATMGMISLIRLT